MQAWHSLCRLVESLYPNSYRIPLQVTAVCAISLMGRLRWGRTGIKQTHGPSQAPPMENLLRSRGFGLVRPEPEATTDTLAHSAKGAGLAVTDVSALLHRLEPGVDGIRVDAVVLGTSLQLLHGEGGERILVEIRALVLGEDGEDGILHLSASGFEDSLVLLQIADELRCRSLVVDAGSALRVGRKEGEIRLECIDVHDDCFLSTMQVTATCTSRIGAVS